MKRRIILVAFVISVFCSCSKIDIEKGTPKCLDKKIEAFNTSSVCNDATVKEYTFQGKTVYTFEPGSCGADMTTEVINFDCVTLGYLGGIVGNTTINGAEFSTATFIKTIWKK